MKLKANKQIKIFYTLEEGSETFKKNGVRQSELAKYLGITRAYMSDIVRGRRYCSELMFQKIKQYLALKEIEGE